MILKDVMKHLKYKSVYLSACQSSNLGFMEILTQALFIAKWIWGLFLSVVFLSLQEKKTHWKKRPLASIAKDCSNKQNMYRPHIIPGPIAKGFHLVNPCWHDSCNRNDDSKHTYSIVTMIIISPKNRQLFSMWPRLFRFMTMQEAESAYAPLLTARKETFGARFAQVCSFLQGWNGKHPIKSM